MPAPLVAAFVIALALVPQDLKARLPVPGVNAQREAEKAVKERFKGDYARTDRAARLVLVRSLTDYAASLPNDPNLLWASLSQAWELAAQVGEIVPAFEAIGRLLTTFDTDGPALKLAALNKAAAATTTPAGFSIVAAAFLEVADEALTADAFETAEKAASGAAKAAARDEFGWTRVAAAVRLQDIRAIQARHPGAQKAKAALATKADDAAAHLELGRYESFLRGRWEAGLAHLAKSGQPGLAALAAKEAAKPEAPAGQVSIGDGWWEISEREEGLARVLVRRRASVWYGQAWMKADNDARALMGKRLAALGTPFFLEGPGESTAPVGGGGGGPFEDRPGIPSLLIGVRYSSGTIVTAQAGTQKFSNEIVKALQPVYLAGKSQFEGGVYGLPTGSMTEIVAKPGYAVAGFIVKGGTRVDGFRIVFMRIAGFTLDSSDRYESRWIGGKGGGPETPIGVNGSFVVGLRGNRGLDLDSLGVILAPR